MRFHCVSLECLPIHSVFYQTLQDSAPIRKQFWIYLPDRVTNRWIIRVPPTFAGYLAKFSGRTQQRLRNKRRKLETAANGKLRLESITHLQQAPDFVDAVIAIWSHSWKTDRVPMPGENRENLLRVLTEYAQRGWLRSYILHAGEDPIAFVVGYQADGIYYYEELCHKIEWHRYAPGTVLALQVIEDLIRENRPSIIDLTYGANPYMRFLATHSQEVANVLLMRKGVYTATAIGLHFLFRELISIVRMFSDRAGLRTRIRRLLRYSAWNDISR
jgi:CelD/BcsL family acetyltransferase involved in cellulose biosynthesis